MRVALIHDWITGMRGGERCLESFLRLYPSADVYTLIHAPGTSSRLIDRHVRGTSFLQKLPGVRRYHRLLLPLYPAATRSLTIPDEYDLVVSLSHAAVKNVTPPPGTPHICYCFTPMRYAWDQAAVYFGGATRGLWPIIKRLRAWDRNGADTVDSFVAISRFIAARIRCYYQRRSAIVHPPVETGWIERAREGSSGERFLYAGALVPYKRPELVVQACNELKLPLWVVGSGPMEGQLRSLAGPTVTVVGKVSDSELAEYYRRSRALIFPGTEDFGMIPVECMAAGRPVLAYGHGGALDTIRGTGPYGERTGLFIRSDRMGPTVSSICEAIREFVVHEGDFSASVCRRHSQLFSLQRFEEAFQQVVGDASQARVSCG
jgi:glycosyltransferase involved in cell wall biosynthesis